MANWPSTLPQEMSAETTVQDDESRLISPMDAGPASVRNRFTAITETIKSPGMVFTGEQVQTFRTFFRTTLNHGTDFFTWTHPVDGSAKDMRFKTKPEWKCIKPDSSTTNRLWTADFELETKPQ